MVKLIINNIEELSKSEQEEIMDYVSGHTIDFYISPLHCCDVCSECVNTKTIDTEGGIIHVCYSCYVKLPLIRNKFDKNENELMKMFFQRYEIDMLAKLHELRLKYSQTKLEMYKEMALHFENKLADGKSIQLKLSRLGIFGDDKNG